MAGNQFAHVAKIRFSLSTHGHNQGFKSNRRYFGGMRKVALAALLVILLSPLASAETYRISGKATYADTTPVSLDYVYVECEVGAYECYQYRGTKAMTNAYGDFTVVIDAGNEEDGIDILLNLRGENFTHTIDLVKHQNSAEGKVYQDLRLSQNPRHQAFSWALAALLCYLFWSLYLYCYELADVCLPKMGD